MNLFKKVKKKQDENNAQREASVRAAKIEVFYAEVLKLAVEHEMTVGMTKTLLNQLSMELESIFNSRMIADFQDIKEEPVTASEVASEAEKTVTEVPESKPEEVKA